jgi:enoyl-CoA hydratase
LGDTEPIVLLDIEDRVATVTLNRPAARNALSRELTYALWDTVATVGARSEN